MKPSNPAVYECKKSGNTLHTWVDDGATLMCFHCHVVLTPAQAAEVRYDRST